jgi:hypothetical protein
MPGETVRSAVSSKWFERAVRIGHGAKGVVFGGIGYMAARLALGDRDETPDFTGAMEAVADQPLDVLYLGVLALGLFSYAAWRFARAFLDFGEDRKGVRGLFDRAAMLGVGATYAFFGVYAIALLTGMRREDESIDQETAVVLSWPFGEWIVGGLAAGFAIAGVWELVVAFTGRYREEFRNADLARWERGVVLVTGWWGHAARGVIYCVAGGFGIQAAIKHDPNDAKGFAETLWEIGTGPWGDWLLLLLAAGLGSFGIYSIMLALHRHVPDPDSGSAAPESRLP